MAEEVGPRVAESIYIFFREPQNQLLVERLKTANLSFEYTVRQKKDGPLNGMTFVLTGTLPGMSREEAKYQIEAAGGKVASVVTRKTTYTVAGEEAGSKLDKAKSLKIKIISEAELRAMLPAG
jgi:DNA ligase (NAD+)